VRGLIVISILQVELERNIIELNEEESYFPVYKKFLMKKASSFFPAVTLSYGKRRLDLSLYMCTAPLLEDAIL
jgi:hypothetical protein